MAEEPSGTQTATAGTTAGTSSASPRRSGSSAGITDGNSGAGRNGKDDPDHAENVYDEYETTWEEVWTTCCCHFSAARYAQLLYGIISVLFCFYLFGLGLDLISDGAKVVTGCAAGNLLGNETDRNPLTSVMIGTLATVMLQSSSTVTSIIVGLVGAENSLVSVQQAIYMIMGANIGTTVTSTMASLSHFRNSEQFESAFAGATVHDLFNFLTVAVLLPVEIATGYLRKISSSLTRGADTEDGETWEGPVKRYISPLSSRIIKSNKQVINHVAGGGSCSDFYPVVCDNADDPTYDTCTKVGILGCDKSSGECPYFFSAGASEEDDQISGLCVFVIGAFIVFLALSLLVFLLHRLLLGYSTRIILKVTKLNGYVLIAIGSVITMFLQSSSTTTSFLVPFAGMGAVPLEQMFALSIGANLGTTVTALLSAIATDGNQALQVAVAHLMFNLTGFMIWYPIPIVRNVPVSAARRLGLWSRLYQPLAVAYIVVFFVALPALWLGIAALFDSNKSGLRVLASVLTAFLCILLLTFLRWFYCNEGRYIALDYLSEHRRKKAARQTLASDMERVQRTIRALREFTGLGTAADGGGTADASAEMMRATTRQEALTDLADDMDWVEEKLAALIYYTGLPDEFLENGDNDIETNDDNNNSDTVIIRTDSDYDDGDDRPISIWREMPKVYVCLALTLIPLSVWGAIALWKIDTKGARGFAAFIAILLGMCLLAFAVAFCTMRQRMLDYFDYVNKTDAAIASLAQDMACAKSNIRMLFMHSNVKMENLKHQRSRGRHGRLGSGRNRNEEL